jgi:hypothetical protein
MNSTIGRVRRREVARRASPAAARASVKLHVFLASLGVRLGNRFGVSFPVQNLPFGVFSPEGGEVPPGVANGDHILDLGALAASGLLSDDALAAAPAAGSTLNAMLGLGERPRCALRTELSRLLRVGGQQPRSQQCCTTPPPARFICPARLATTRTSTSAFTGCPSAPGTQLRRNGSCVSSRNVMGVPGRNA